MLNLEPQPLPEDIKHQMKSRRALDILRIKIMKEKGEISEAQVKALARQDDLLKEALDKKITVEEKAALKIDQYKEQLEKEKNIARADGGQDRLAEIRSKYDDLKIIDMQVLKGFSEDYERYMTVKGMGKLPIYIPPVGTNNLKTAQAAQAIIKERKDQEARDARVHDDDSNLNYNPSKPGFGPNGEIEENFLDKQIKQMAKKKIDAVTKDQALLRI